MKTKDEIMALAKKFRLLLDGANHEPPLYIFKTEELEELVILCRADLMAERDAALEGWRCECSTEDACRFARERDAAIAERDALKEALRDMLSGWIYIRQTHGDLYGVGWDRAQDKAIAAMKGTS